MLATLAGAGEGPGSELASFGDFSVEAFFEFGAGVALSSESLF